MQKQSSSFFEMRLLQILKVIKQRKKIYIPLLTEILLIWETISAKAVDEWSSDKKMCYENHGKVLK